MGQFVLPRPFFALAPMLGVTETAFRQIVASCAAPDLFFSESVNVDELQGPKRARLLDSLRFSAEEQPIFAQLWGSEPENFRRAARDVMAMGFAGIDLNMGSPEQVVTGLSGTLMDDRALARRVIHATRLGAGPNAPLSVKTRLGATAFDPSWVTFLLQQPLNMLIIHGCTKDRASEAAIDWSSLGKVRVLRDQLAPHTLIVGNGHVANRLSGEALAITHGLDGIMIGRGIFKDLFAFATASPWQQYELTERLALYQKHIELYQTTHHPAHHDQPALARFSKLYAADHPDDAFHTKVQQAVDVAALHAAIV